jgi:hypothetical protein
MLQLKAVAADAAALDEAYHPHLVQTLAKWSAKVQAVAPNVLMTAGRTSFSQKSNNNVRSAPALVDDALLGPAREKLLDRGQERKILRALTTPISISNSFGRSLMLDRETVRMQTGWQFRRRRRRRKWLTPKRAKAGDCGEFMFIMIQSCTKCQFLATRCMKSCRTSWFLLLREDNGTRSRLMSCSRACLARALSMQWVRWMRTIRW